MGPKINGNSVSDLVLAAVQKQLEVEMGDYKDLLNNALARINSLEEEIAQCRQHSNPIFPIIKSSSKSDICRHWLKNQCTWKQKCRFSHGGGASTTSSLSYFNAKDLEEVALYDKEKVDKSVQVELSLDYSPSSTSTCEIPLLSSEVVGCLLNSNLSSRPCSVSGVLQPELVGAALSNSVADSVMDDLLESVVSSSNAKQPVPPGWAVPVVDVTKLTSPVTGPCIPASKDEEWVEDMLVTIGKLELKYDAKYKPLEEGGVIFSAEVAIPKVDFSKVKPHLHRKLPKPESVPVQACSIDPTLHTSCTICANARSQGIQHPERHSACAPPFELPFPFGALPGFVTSLGVVAVPEEPIGGYVYDGGSGDATK